MEELLVTAVRDRSSDRELNSTEAPAIVDEVPAAATVVWREECGSKLVSMEVAPYQAEIPVDP